MSAQLITNASHCVSSEAEPATRLDNWPVRGWVSIAPQHAARYLRLQQRAAHWGTRHFDLAVHLMRLYSEEQNSIDHRARIARLERLIKRVGSRASAALDDLFTEGDRLRGANADPEREAV